MQILFVNTTFGYVGGVEQHIILACDGLRLRGYSCSIAYQCASGRDASEFASHFNASYSLQSSTWKEVLDRDRPDCIYIHKWDSIQPILTAVGGKIPLIRMFHDHDIYCPRRHKYLSFSRKICTYKAGLACYLDLAFLERKQGKIAYAPILPKLRELARNRTLDCVVVGSSYMRKELLRNGFSSNSIKVIPPSVQDYDKPPVPLADKGGILYVGQLVRGKGVDTLLRALALIRSTLTLTIVGAGNDEEFLHALCDELGIDQRVQFLGWVEHNRLGDLYDEAMMVVVPSRWPEPFGMVGLEALLRQRPVIASEVGGIPDWLEDGETGLLFPVNDEASLARAIDRLAEDTQLASELGRRGRENVLERFSFDAFITRLIDLIQERITQCS